MSDLTVRVFDDDAGFGAGVVKSIKKGSGKAGVAIDVEQVASNDCEEWLAPLRAADEGPPASNKDPFSKVDLVVIDYDLRRTSVQTAEKLAYWLRCYSTCNGILALNMRPTPTFELTLQATPHGFSWADLGVYERDLELAQFWGKDSKRAAYRPSYWPDIRTLGGSVERTAAQAAKGLTQSIQEFFDIPEEVVHTFPKRMFGSYVPGLQATLAQVAESRLHREDEAHVTQTGSGRIAASTLRWWLHNMVLPAQDVLIEPQHLLSRFPSLLGRPTNRMKTANLLAKPGGKLPSPMRKAPGLFKRLDWLPRSAWWYRVLATSEEIAEVKDPSHYASLNLYFAEDTCRFSSNEHESYTLGFPTQFSRRYIHRPTGAPDAYGPAALLLQ